MKRKINGCFEQTSRSFLLVCCSCSVLSISRLNTNTTFPKVCLSDKHVYKYAVSFGVLGSRLLQHLFDVRLVRRVHFDADATEAFRNHVVVSELQ